MKDKNLGDVLKDIGHYFHFLFERGYKIAHVEELPMGDWEVSLESPDNFIKIGNDQGKIIIVFSPVSPNSFRENLFSLEALIYFLSKAQRFVGKFEASLFRRGRKAQLERLASLLKQYIDQIAPYFGKDFEKHKRELILARDKYFSIYLDRYVPKRKHNDWK